MAQEYNIYLRKRLTEFDVIIKNLPYRDGLIMYNKMYLDAMVNYLCLQRFIIGESDANLRTEIDELLERVFNTFQSKVEIDLDVELAAGKPISGQSDLVFATSPFEIGEETYEVFQNLTRLTTYHNELKAYVQSLDSVEAVTSIVYGMTLPDPYNTEMNEKLAVANEQMQAIIARLSSAANA